ncbi:hypothetical protein HDV63DRAFT_222719 [Trichoderma sp. SZMC 28014]
MGVVFLLGHEVLASVSAFQNVSESENFARDIVPPAITNGSPLGAVPAPYLRYLIIDHCRSELSVLHTVLAPRPYW